MIKSALDFFVPHRVGERVKVSLARQGPVGPDCGELLGKDFRVATPAAH